MELNQHITTLLYVQYIAYLIIPVLLLKQNVAFYIPVTADICSHENKPLVCLVCIKVLVCKLDYASCLEEHLETVLQWLSWLG